MPRPERALDPGAGPVESLAAELRKLRQRAGSPGYRELAKRSGFAVTTLAQAAGGRRLPSLAVTLAYAQACGGDTGEWERRWRRAAAEDAAQRPLATDDEKPPYQGLTSYETVDGDRFFGRDRMVAQLVDMLARQRFVAVFGASGSGKSSLLRAGVIPAMCRGPQTAPENVDGAAHGGCVAVLLRPGPEPLEALRKALSPVPSGSAVLLVVDQFEELFTAGADPAERAEFVRELAGLVSRAGSRTRVVVGVRADFYARCSELPGLAALMAGASVPVGPLSEDELREVITGPARLVGLTVERALVTKILADVAGQPAVLPHVSHALLETWRRRRSDTLTIVGYDATGGVAGAIAQTAEAAYERLGANQRETARRVLVRLVALGQGVDDTRRRIGRAELDFVDVDTVLELMAGERLIVLGEDTVEIAHEALIGAWPRLHGWLHADRATLHQHRQLTDAAAVWQVHDRDPGALYRGARLVAWEGRTEDQLNAIERTFLAESRQLAARELLMRRRRTRAAFSGLIAAVVAMSVLAGLALTQAHRANDQRDLATSHLLVASARAQLQVDQEVALLLAMAAYDTKPTREAGSVLRQAVVDSRVRAVLPVGPGQVFGVAYSPDGRQVATSGVDGTVRVWDRVGPDRWQAPPRVLRGASGDVLSPVFSPDGHRLAAAGNDGTVTVWDLAAGGVPVALKGHEGLALSVAFSPDGRRVASASLDGTVRIWDPAGPGAPVVLHVGAPALGVAFSPDGRRLAASGEGLIWIWDEVGRGDPHLLRGHDGAAEDIAFSPDGRRLASAGRDGTVRVWETAGGDPPVVLRGNDGVAKAVAFSPDGQRIASAHNGSNSIRVWSAVSADDPLVLHGHGGLVWSVAFSPDGQRIASGSGDGTIRFWDPRHPGSPVLRHGPDRDVWTVDFSRDGRLIASGGADGTVHVWPNTGPREPMALAGHLGQVAGVAVSPDGRRVASAGIDRTVRIWDVAGGAAPIVLHGHDGAVSSVDFSPDGQKVASAGDGTVRIWNTTGQGQPLVLHGHQRDVGQVEFSPDGRRVAIAGDDRTVRIWDVTGRGQPTVLRTPSSVVWYLTFSPDGRRLAAGTNDGGLLVWDADGHGQPLVLAGHTGSVWSVAFSPDGRLLASSGEDGGVRFWDTTTGHELVAYRGNNTLTGQVRFSSDPYRLVSAHRDGTIREWTCEVCGPIEQVRALAGRVATRSLTPEERGRFRHETRG